MTEPLDHLELDNPRESESDKQTRSQGGHLNWLSVPEEILLEAQSIWKARSDWITCNPFRLFWRS